MQIICVLTESAEPISFPLNTTSSYQATLPWPSQMQSPKPKTTFLTSPKQKMQLYANIS